MKIDLKLDKKDLTFSLGLGFLGELLEDLDCGIEGLMEGIQKNPFKYIPKLMFHSYKYNQVRNGLESEYNLYTFTDLIDNDGGVISGNVSKFLESFTLSMTKDVPKEPNKIPQKGKQKAVSLKK